MQSIRRPIFAPLNYWRTLLLVSCVGLFVAEVFADDAAVMLCTLVSAFVFTSYERRRWISVSRDFQIGDILLRICLAFCVTYWLTQHMNH